MNGQARYPQSEGDGARPFEAVYEELIVSITRYVERRVPYSDDAQDIIAEAMCELVASCRRNPDTRHFRPLLYTIAKHRIADYYAARAKRVSDVPIEDAPEIAAPGSLAHDAQASEELRAVQAALATLREEDREMITLRGIVGLEIPEIAELMDAPTGVVRTRLYRARRALKRALRDAQRLRGGADIQEGRRST